MKQLVLIAMLAGVGCVADEDSPETSQESAETTDGVLGCGLPLRYGCSVSGVGYGLCSAGGTGPWTTVQGQNFQTFTIWSYESQSGNWSTYLSSKGTMKLTNGMRSGSSTGLIYINTAPGTCVRAVD